MSVFSVIRITTMVGLSAIKLVSTVMKIRDEKKQGLINTGFIANNNSAPYVPNPVVYNSIPTPVPVPQPVPVPTPVPVPQPIPTPVPVQQPQQTWTGSRRFMTGPTATMLFPQYTNLNSYMSQSRRYTNYNVPEINWNQPMSIPNVPQYTSPMRNINNIFSGYNPNRNITYTQNFNSQMPYSRTPELKWADKSYGQMMEERCMHQQPHIPPRNRYGPPMFDWNSPLLRNNNVYYDQDEMVPMFCMDDGTPLFGPVQCSAV